MTMPILDQANHGSWLVSHEQRIRDLERAAGELQDKIAAYERQLADAAASPMVRGALAALGIKLPGG
jgi:hypothetical protein